MSLNISPGRQGWPLRHGFRAARIDSRAEEAVAHARDRIDHRRNEPLAELQIIGVRRYFAAHVDDEETFTQRQRQGAHGGAGHLLEAAPGWAEFDVQIGAVEIELAFSGKTD